MPDYIELFIDMLKANDPVVEDINWDDFQTVAAQYLFDSLGEDDLWWGVH
jgi:hypothetical protein